MKKVHFITAGAGSGKTYTLTTELVKRIKKDGVSPSEVLLTTFTKAAAAEFQQKASSALLKAGMETESLQLAGAKIGTIDSVSQSFVEKYWYMLGLSPELNVIADTEVKIFENESLDGVVEKENLKLFSDVQKCFKISVMADNRTVDDPDFWKTHLKKVIEYARTYGIEDFSESLKKSEELIDKIFCQDIKVDWDYVKQFLSEDALYCLKKKDGSLAKCDLAKDKVTKIKDLSYFAHTFYQLLGLLKFLTKEITPEEGSSRPIEGMCDLSEVRGNSIVIPYSWVKFIEKIEPCLQSKEFGAKLKEYVRCIFAIAKKWQEEYKEYKKKHRLIDYVDMEGYFLDLLSKDKVIADIQSDYKLIMVDEFQDCNPLQIEIFSRLADIIADRPDGKGQSIWVGDKKQSIYGFRGTDMALVNAVLDKFNSNADGLTTANLPDSYRSRMKLVDAANEIFAEVFDDKSIALNAKRVVSGKDDMPDTSALVDWHFEATTKDAFYKSLAEKVKGLLDGTDGNIKEVVEFEHNAEGYKQLGKRSVKPGDIVILSKSNKDIDKIVKELNDLRINVNVVEKNLIDFVEIQLLKAILCYCVQKTDYSKAQILYLFDGKRTESIIEERLSGDLKDDNGIIEKINGIIENTKGQSLSQLVETLIIELDIWNVVRKWGSVTRRHAHISSFRQIVAGYEEHTRLLSLAPSIMDFLNYFDKKDVVPEAPYIKDENAVSVITYHKSKGLEWPIVILDSLNDNPLSTDQLLKELFGVGHAATSKDAVERSMREEYITILPDIKAGGSLPEAIATILNPLIEEGSDIYERVKEERARVLYVGFTRAKDYLVSTSYSRGETYCWLNANNAYSELNVWKTKQIVEREIVPESDSKDTPGGTYERIQMPEVLGKSELPKYITPSTLHKKGFSVSVTEPKNLGCPMTMNFDDEVMSKLGNCIHDFFASFDELEPKNTSVAKAKAILNRHGMTNLADKAEELVVSINTFYNYMEKTYGTPVEILHEMPILYRNDLGQILTGSIDLVWKTPNGCVVVDFKNKKNEETATDSAKGYAPQLMSYKTALEKVGEKVTELILFYPVQSLVVLLNVE